MDNSNIENPNEEAEVKTKPKSKSSKKSALDFKKKVWYQVYNFHHTY